MKKSYLFNLITFDGFFDGPNGDLSWHNVDNEFHEFAISQLNETDTILFGRVTYEMMASYWPTETAIKNDPIVADKMNSLQRIVFSKKLDEAAWSNSRVIKENADDELSELKQQFGKDIAIFGGSNLAMTFIQQNLIDEYRIMVNPVVLGRGAPLFEGLNCRFNLKLLKIKTFKSGNALLYYKPNDLM